MNRDLKRNIKYLSRCVLHLLWYTLCVFIELLLNLFICYPVWRILENFVKSETILFVCEYTFLGIVCVCVYIKGRKIYEKVYDMIDDFIRM